MRIEGAQVNVKRKVRYIGVGFDRKGTIEGHVSCRIRLATLRLGIHSPVLRLDSVVDFDTRVRILRIVAQPTAFYGMEVVIRGS